jgi:hypothetical protein
LIDLIPLLLKIISSPDLAASTLSLNLMGRAFDYYMHIQAFATLNRELASLSARLQAERLQVCLSLTAAAVLEFSSPALLPDFSAVK